MLQKLLSNKFWKAAPWVALFWLGLAIAFQFHQDRLVAEVKSEKFKQAEHALTNVLLSLKKDLEALRSDLDMVSENLDLRHFSGRPSAESRAKVGAFFQNLSKSRKGRYQQIRMIDLAGHEKIRVDHINGLSVPVADNQLQDKSGRGYVKAGLQLLIDDYHLSALDLNVEHGKIVEPFQPTLRVVKPIQDDLGRRSGLVVINVSAREFLERMTETTAPDFSTTWVVNTQGHWMAGPKPEDDWGWLFPDKSPRPQPFQELYNWAWKQLLEAEAGLTVELQNGDFWGVGMVITPEKASGLRAWSKADTVLKRWYLVSTPRIDSPVAAWRSQATMEIGSYYATLAVFGAILLLLVSWLRALTQDREQAQRLMEERYRSVLTNAPTGIILTNDNGTIELVNPLLAQLLGYPASNLTGMPVQRLLPGRKLNQLWRSPNPALTVTEQASVLDNDEQKTLHAQHRDGRLLPVEIVLSKAEFSGRYGVIASVTDLSARIKAEEDRDQLAERLSLSASAAGLGSFIEDLEANTITANERTLELWGLDLNLRDQAIPAKMLWDRIHPQDREKLGQKIENNSRLDIRVEALDGKIRHLQIDRQVKRDETKGRMRIGAVMDYTKEREQAAALTIMQQEQHSIMEAIPLGLGRCQNWAWTWVNPELANWLGAEASRLIGRPVDEHLALEEDKKDLRETFDRCLRSGQSIFLTEFTLSHKAGDKQVRANVAILNPDTESAIFAITDITHDKLQQQSLANALKRAAAGEKAKANFVSMISHEIRTPLNGLLGTLQLLNLTSMDEEQTKLLNVSRDAGEMLKVLVDEVLDFSKQEAGKLELNPVPNRLSTLLHRFKNVLDTLPRAPDVAWGASIEPALDTVVMVDDFRLRQVIGNLVSNAFKFTLKGSVDLEARLSGQDKDDVELTIDIKDTGIGMSPDVVERLFTPFTQADSGHARKFGGSGLGLSISAGLIKQMGGLLSVVSVPGQGSTFSLKVKFPRAKDHIGEGKLRPWEWRESGADLTDAGETRMPLTGRTILVVDDNAVNRFVCRGMLGRYGAFVLEASDGARAVAMLRDQDVRVDVVLMDLQMPVMDGFEAVEVLRNSGKPHLEALPIIALTGDVQPSVVDAVRAAKMQGHAAKPIIMNALIEQITEVIRASS